MDFDTFKEIVGTVKTKYPHFFELEHDKIPTMKDVIAFQEQYQISLPEKYIQFLLNFGGGYSVVEVHRTANRICLTFGHVYFRLIFSIAFLLVAVF